MSDPLDETTVNTTVEINGIKVSCYGEWREDSNALIVGTYSDGRTYDEFEEIYADGADSWSDLAEKLAPWAKRIELEIDELVAC